MPHLDKVLICRDCASSFTFTAGEQAYYETKGLTHQPTRCRDCREARKKGEAPAPGDGYVNYGAFASFGGRNPRQMHPTTCSNCGQATEVPFQPRQDRPVYCASCFDTLREGEEDGGRKAADERRA